LIENYGHENDGPSKLQDMKLQDMKKTDQIAWPLFDVEYLRNGTMEYCAYRITWSAKIFQNT